MIERGHRLPLKRQAELLGLSRGTLYYSPCAVSAADLAIMRRIDELHLDYPFAGSRMLRDLLRGEGTAIGRERVTTLMRRMGIEALYRRPHTSKPADGHKVFPYLLRGLSIERPNQVWAMDLTYIPMARGFVYLAAVMDWFSRRVLAWRVSIGMEVEFCLDALDEALIRYGRPDIFNTDQGSQARLKWSLQHLEGGGCDDEAQAAFGSVWSGAIVLTRSSAGGRTRGAATVLGGDRGRRDE